MSSGGYFATVIGVEDDKIGIAAGLDCTLLREEIEDLCGIGACHIHQPVEVYLSRPHTIGVGRCGPPEPEFRWGFCEVIPAHRLLSCEIKRGVVRAYSVDQSLPQGIPEHFLILLIAQGEET
jgi:hypothetical protein